MADHDLAQLVTTAPPIYSTAPGHGSDHIAITVVFNLSVDHRESPPRCNYH
ncbi:hypothetical protein C8F04DRAFT_1260770 [Mycena alexandri]|uniref:Uncharacterized protein n=1 Tax=Mycena alexandri TaxID=1745969 RepID=A0AAD6SUW0_9AGAR|nr:hypothetical protein C8F04DRAFT_1260770 [Mycena alexandri]